MYLVTAKLLLKYKEHSPNWSVSPAKAGGSPPPPPPDPGVGGLFSRLFTLVVYSSSLSALGSCIQKKNFRVEDLNLRMKTRPVVHCLTRLYSMSSGKMIRSCFNNIFKIWVNAFKGILKELTTKSTSGLLSVGQWSFMLHMCNSCQLCLCDSQNVGLRVSSSSASPSQHSTFQ